jgi:hypothetical protein
MLERLDKRVDTSQERVVVESAGDVLRVDDVDSLGHV